MTDNSNIIKEKSYSFALRIIRLARELREMREFTLSEQIIKSGTSIGANVEEAQGASSSKDFLHKMTIAYREARETNYWLRLVRDSNTFPEEKLSSIVEESEELCHLLTAITKTTKSKLIS